MVDISTDNQETGIFSFGDCDPDAWFTCIVKSTKLGRSSSLSLGERLQLLICNTPKMMKKCHEAACETYMIKLARYLAWDPVAEEAKYQAQWAAHEAALRHAICSYEDSPNPGDLMPPRIPVAPVEPAKPVAPVPDFNDVCLEARFVWLQYNDFEDAGIEIVEIIAGAPSCTRGNVLSVE